MTDLLVRLTCSLRATAPKADERILRWRAQCALQVAANAQASEDLTLRIAILVAEGVDYFDALASEDDRYDDYDDTIDDSRWDYEDPPLYDPGELAGMNETRLRSEWQRQCRIHDRGVDDLPMGHPTIENAADRLRLVEKEQALRGFETGPGLWDAS